MRASAVVTGGGTGIGRAVAARLAGAEYDVVITGRRAAVLAGTADELNEQETSRTVGWVAFDAADPATVNAALVQLPHRLDVLVNNAGGNAVRGQPQPGAGDLAAVRAQWLANLDSNLLSAVLVTHAVEPRLVDGARVVSIGSIAASRGSGSYGAAKAALTAWNVDLARRLGPRQIVANIVSPGLVVDTEFFGDVLPTAPRPAGRRHLHPPPGSTRGHRRRSGVPRISRCPPHHRPGPARQRRSLAWFIASASASACAGWERATGPSRRTADAWDGLGSDGRGGAGRCRGGRRR